jgi:hypothetical protein
MTNKNFLLIIGSVLALATPASSQGSQITLYFKNDSINAFQISDAYETHSMGMRYEQNNSFLELDLAIVSPDMHIYKNEYRVANRSFGEIVSLKYGKTALIYDDLIISADVTAKAIGKFGIDALQDLIHNVLDLQPVNKVNDLVRMPDQYWYGFGSEVRKNVFNRKNMDQIDIGTNLYFGSDRAEISPFAAVRKKYANANVSGEIGLRSVFYDSIVSAEPIKAKHRRMIPYLELGFEFEYQNLTWFIEEHFSAPTIQSDNSLFAVIHAGVTHKF